MSFLGDIIALLKEKYNNDLYIFKNLQDTAKFDECVVVTKMRYGGRDNFNNEECAINVLVKSKKYDRTEEIMENIRDILNNTTHWEGQSYTFHVFKEFNSATDLTITKDFHYKTITIKTLCTKK